MTFQTDYWAVINAIKTKIEELKTAGTLKDVIIGQKTVIPTFPVAFIIPIKDSITAETSAKNRHHIGVRTIIVNQGPEPEVCLDTCIDIACAAYDKIMADPTLGAVCERTFPQSFEPDYSIGDSKTLSWVIIETSSWTMRTE